MIFTWFSPRKQKGRLIVLQVPEGDGGGGYLRRSSFGWEALPNAELSMYTS